MAMTAAAIHKIKVHRIIRRWVIVRIHYRIATKLSFIRITMRTQIRMIWGSIAP